MTKFTLPPDPSGADFSIVRIALAHAYATREAIASSAVAAGPPIGSRAPPSALA